MGVTVDFVGLVYFGRDGEQGERRVVLIPDGRTPDNGIEPHIATINIATSDLIDADWWPEGLETRSTAARGRRSRSKRGVVQAADFNAQQTPLLTFEIKDSSNLEISGVDGKGVDATQHDNHLPPLARQGLIVNRERAETIARMTIGSGTLKAMKLPFVDQNGQQRGAVVTRLVTNGRGGPVTITAGANGAKKTIRVREGAEIVIANISPDMTGGTTQETAHFQIYKKLDPDHVGLLSDPVIDPALEVLVSNNPFLAPQLGNFPEEKCSNTCC